MMVGHALLAFALAALVANRYWPAERALTFGVVAGAFATIPDVDMAYALVGLAQAGFGGVWSMTNAFWGSSQLVHRAVTHSLVVALVAAPGFVLLTGRRDKRAVGAVILSALVWISFAESGVLGGGVMLVFVLAGTALALAVDARTDLQPRELLLAAAFGLLSHPFGDVFTGEPPQFLYPFDTVLLHNRVALYPPDPTLNLLAIFGVELAAAWLAVFAYFRLRDGHRDHEKRLLGHVHGRATLGAGYALTALFLPAPTLDVSYHFVFSVLAVGAVGVGPKLYPLRSFRVERDPRAWLCTGMAAVTVAVLAYAGAYITA
ncbi:LexA-binding, inner membrane-associated putative hydrolase [Haladaptatus litoreus]|uniref:LexA-binding, inner membrane-associated putative hydrolase n=1 Tax=Haladaptatus litoreus TaxID=553468 RepID=A0A1N6Z7P0_9EURY|nr:metal-dependent hydrolase [Haladaptatus litoreus]SIR22834.1 LexA-binding, inner membrane-associated putative hydrolase [Haladaptatus litoreus]